MKESCTFNSSMIVLKDNLEAVFEATSGALGAEGKPAAAACCKEGEEEPIAIAYRTASGKILYYSPE